MMVLKLIQKPEAKPPSASGVYLGQIQTMSYFPWRKYKGIKGRNTKAAVQCKVEATHKKANLFLESVTHFLWLVHEIFVLGK